MIKNLKTATKSVLFTDGFIFFQGSIRYSLIGDYPTQSFFRLDTVTGIISTVQSVRLDGNLASAYIARVTAIDNLRPNQVATSTVVISIIRNPNTPQFTLPSYTNTISESTNVGTVVLNVTATDRDFSVSIFGLVSITILNNFNTFLFAFQNVFWCAYIHIVKA